MRQVARSSALDAPHWPSASVPHASAAPPRRDTLGDRLPTRYVAEQPHALTARRASLPHKSTSVVDEGDHNGGVPDVFLAALGRRPRSAMPAPDRRQQVAHPLPLAAARTALASGDYRPVFHPHVHDADSVHEQSDGSRASSPPSGLIPRVSPSLSVDACVLPVSPVIADSASTIANSSFASDARAFESSNSNRVLRPPQRPHSAIQLPNAAPSSNPLLGRESDRRAPPPRLHLSPNAFGSALHTRNSQSPPKTRAVSSVRTNMTESASDRPPEVTHPVDSISSLMRSMPFVSPWTVPCLYP